MVLLVAVMGGSDGVIGGSGRVVVMVVGVVMIRWQW